MTEPLHTKYRPVNFKEVLGQEHFVSDLRGMLKEGTAHAYLFHGPSGCGKTTLARLCAKELGCGVSDIREVDGATNNGVEQVRALQEMVRYKPLSGGAAVAVIIDECQRITAAAYDALLKIIEEPPAHLYWFFCTTEPTKVPLTVRNRCQQFTVRACEPQQLEQLLTKVAGEEGLDIPDGIIEFIASKSDGSPRRALVNLERCVHATSRKDAAVKMEQVLNEDAVLELARFLCSNKSRAWTKAMELVGKIGDNNPEGVRIMIVHYVAKCLINAKSEDDAVYFLRILEPFSQAFVTRDGMGALMLAIGRVLLADPT